MNHFEAIDFDITQLNTLIKDDVKVFQPQQSCSCVNRQPYVRVNEKEVVCLSCSLIIDEEVINTSTARANVQFYINGTSGGRLFGATSTVDDTVREKKISDRLMSILYKSDYEDESIPVDIINSVAQKYVSLRVVKRAGGLASILAMLTYNECIKANLPKKSKCIAKLMSGLDQSSQLSSGERELRKLAQSGIIELPVEHGNINDFISQYFARLLIQDTIVKDNKMINCKMFVIDLINATSIENLADPNNNCRPTTRCAGAIWILSKQLQLKVSKDDIAKECTISKTTFIRFYNLVQTYSKMPCISEVFNKHGVASL